MKDYKFYERNPNRAPITPEIRALLSRKDIQDYLRRKGVEVK